MHVTLPFKCLCTGILFFSGDEILEVNGESLHGLTHLQAIQTFKVHFVVAVCPSKWDLLYLYLIVYF